MIDIFLIVNMLCIILFLYMALRGRLVWTKLLGLNLATSTIVVEIVLYAVKTNLDMYLDIALAFALIGFIGTQFIAVFIRKQGVLWI